MRAFSVIFRNAAARDIEEIKAWISADRGADFARDFTDRLISYCEGLSTTPQRGTLRDDVRPGLRIIGWRRAATIAFRVDEKNQRVIVLGTFLAGRDVTTVMKKR